MVIFFSFFFDFLFIKNKIPIAKNTMLPIISIGLNLLASDSGESKSRLIIVIMQIILREMKRTAPIKSFFQVIQRIISKTREGILCMNNANNVSNKE